MITEYIDLNVKQYVQEKWGDHSSRVKRNMEEKMKLLFLFILDEHQKVEESYFYVNISSKKMRKFKVKSQKKGKVQLIGYAEMVKGLVEVKALEIQKRYKVGEYTMSYRPHTWALDSPVISDPILFKHLKKTEIQHYLEKYPEYSKNIMDATRVTIDIVQYEKWLQENEGIRLKPAVKKVKNDKGRLYPIKVERRLDQERITRYLFEAYKINAGKLWFKVSDLMCEDVDNI